MISNVTIITITTDHRQLSTYSFNLVYKKQKKRLWICGVFYNQKRMFQYRSYYTTVKVI